MLILDNRAYDVEMSEQNKSYLEYFDNKLGQTPNLFLAMMQSDHALSAYYPFHTRKTSLSRRESEAITLVVSQQNRAMYCLSAHTMIAKLNGFSEEEIIEIRQGSASFDSKLDALVKLVAYLVNHRDSINVDLLNVLFEQGYTQAHLIDVIQAIGDSFIANITGKVFKLPIDFPLAKEL